MPDGIIARILLPWTTFSADFFRVLNLECRQIPFQKMYCTR
ncbi:hypothetical protein L798_08975 [Zootermopsis nevadensis]|uniref:Uncharacterized protein n=1 Tax=Zootermopsis nevadensis TaxID=136037 RepID=A0A067RK38_ZOONE|nr:hypothetical protein L798_08975 [Zootermopsis nevadensis]